MEARNFDLTKAVKMYGKSMAWRQEIGADRILETYRVPDAIRRYYPGGICGHDREGRPVWIDPLGQADIKGIMLSVKKTDILKSMVYRLEGMHAEFRKSSEVRNKRVDQCIQILDMEGFGMKIMWKPALNLFIEIIRLLEDNYPETLHRSYIINAPRIFHVGWKVLKTFIDEDIARKFKFIDGDYTGTLLDLIDPDQLPAHYGGTKRDPDGSPKCEKLVCFGGDVPRELYKNREDVFHAGVPFERRCLGRHGVLTIGFSIPDPCHTLQYIASVDWGTIDYGVFLCRDYIPTDGATGEPEIVRDDINKMDAYQPIRTMDCSRVPEDGIIVFERAGYYCIQFVNTSRLHRKTLTYSVQVKAVQRDDVRAANGDARAMADERTK